MKSSMLQGTLISRKLIVGLAVVSLWPCWAFAFTRPTSTDIVPDYDSRLATPGPTRLRLPEATLSQFESRGFLWTLNARTGALRSLMAGEDRLSPAFQGDPEQAARDYIASNEQALGLALGGAETLALESSHTTRHNGTQHLWFIQRHQGVEVFQGRIGVHLDRQNRIFAVSADEVTAALPAAVTPVLAAREALGNAAAAIGEPFDDLPPVEVTPASARIRIFEKAHLGSAPQAELVLFHTGREARPAWMVRIEPSKHVAAYRVIVDAADGRMLYLKNRLLYASGLVFTSDPLTDPTREMVDFGVTPASPAGWLGTSNSTNGNNVHAYHDPGINLFLLCANGAPVDVTPPSSFQEFVYPLNLAQDPETYKDAAITNLFYLNNFTHDYLYALGFDEQAGNYQVDNFGLGGAAGDPVNAEAQDGWPNCANTLLPNTNNANFMPSSDGEPGRMQMYVWTLTNPNRDGDLDRDIVIHEYCHGLSTRLVGGPSCSTCLDNHQGGSMGEGWSDFFPASITDDDVVGEYAYGQPGGIRTYPYGQSPYTFGDLGQVGNSGCEVHDDGEIWAATLWQLRRDYMVVYGPQGRTMLEQNVVDSMAIMPASPSFLDARNGMVQAAINNGEDRCLVWQIFAARGMGVDASVAGNGCDTVSEGFAVPAGCECETPQAPDGLQAATVGPMRVEISWNSQAATGAMAYEVRRAAGGCTGIPEPLGSIREPATSFVDEPAAEGLYGYEVTAVPSMGTLCSATSACIEVDLQCTAGAPDVEPNSLRLAKTGTELIYSWSSSGSGFWNLHATTERAAIADLYLAAESIVATVAAPQHSEPMPSDSLLYLSVHGADGCTGESLP